MTDTEGPFPHRETGFALVLSLLFTGIVLIMVASTAASLAGGSRRGGVDERRAFQALLIAESGINSLPRKAGEYVRTKPFTGSTVAELQIWLTGSSSVTNAGGLRGYLAATAPATGNAVSALTALTATTFTAQSTGTDGQATKVVLHDFEIRPRLLPPGLRPNSGIISRPRIQAGGSSSVTTEFSPAVTTVVGNNVSNGSTVTVPVASTAGLETGDYVTISGSTYRVTALTASSISAARVISAATPPSKLSGDVGLVLNPVTTALPTVSAAGQTVLHTPTVTSFRVGETITVGQGVSSRRATVQALDAAAGTLSVTWVAGAPTTVAEGTALTRDVTAMSSAGQVTIEPSAKNKQNNFYGYTGGVKTNDCTTNTSCSGSDNAALAAASGSEFTRLLLGLTDAELNDLVPLTPAPSSPLPNNTNVGILRIAANDYQKFFKSNSTYSGIIIVDGVMTSNVTGTTIHGLVYFRDDVEGTFNGSATVYGAIAVRGGALNVNNVLSGNLSVHYDAVTLQQIFTTASGSRQYAPVAGSWRQH
ncbi:MULTISPECIES: hypothetical protein [Deinococcus]|uniref:DUF4900 domain-containing protein n=1 Tax=Deinococcus rufus TaxID=2136097 RepID=A0ABV7ZGQ1_9DEIO|nr:hypothetical protein [Deinococcus sp. AB2017081]WQE96966.1 hypothetical protein U2P90_08690 [Deinococcus sp. AB2017081]